MCRRVDCAKCGRPTFAGCGMHVEQVLGNVPPAERCHCREESPKQAGEKAGESPGTDLRSRLRALFGR
jgi:hypothetical protein